MRGLGGGAGGRCCVRRYWEEGRLGKGRRVGLGERTWAAAGGDWAVSAATASSTVSACLVRASVEAVNWAIVAEWTVDAQRKRRVGRNVRRCIVLGWGVVAL